MPPSVGLIRMTSIAAFMCFLCGPSGALAQSVGPDESPGRGAAAGLEGGTPQAPALTISQRSALYRVIRQHGGGTPAMEIDPTIGASVSPAAELSSLPEQAGIDDSTALKYAMVEGDIVVIDPVRMRVVDIIHGSMRP